MSKLKSIINDIFHEATTSFKKAHGDSIFNNIYGHDDIKQIIQMALKASTYTSNRWTWIWQNTVLENIKGYYKDRAYFTIGAHSTKAGMLDYLFEKI